MVRFWNRGQTSAAAAEAPAAVEELLPIEWARHALRVRVTSELERKKRVRPAKYEPFTVNWLESRVGPDDRFFDIGANIGTFSLMAAAMIADGRGEGTVFAFEPSFSSFARLCENVGLNGLDEVVVPVPLLLGATSGLRALAYRDTSPGASRHRLLEEDPERVRKALRKGRGSVQRMVMLSLDDLVATCGLPTPTLMKIDVDGAELEVLRGAAELLRAPALRSVIIEMDPALTDPCLALLAEAGLNPAERFSTGHARDVHYAVLDRGAAG